MSLPHEYIPAQLGHANQVCKWCAGTPNENAVIAPNHCDKRPVDDTPSSPPPSSEPCPYGIGGNLWPGLAKVMEEMMKLGVELAKLQGTGGDRQHWTGDLLPRIRCEISDVRAALQFFEDVNPEFYILEHGKTGLSGADFMDARRKWKRALFLSWSNGEVEENWPKPEEFGLPARDAQ